jgi:hypothetical protein
MEGQEERSRLYRDVKDGRSGWRRSGRGSGQLDRFIVRMDWVEERRAVVRKERDLGVDGFDRSRFERVPVWCSASRKERHTEFKGNMAGRGRYGRIRESRSSCRCDREARGDARGGGLIGEESVREDSDAKEAAGGRWWEGGGCSAWATEWKEEERAGGRVRARAGGGRYTRRMARSTFSGMTWCSSCLGERGGGERGGGDSGGGEAGRGERRKG